MKKSILLLVAAFVVLLSSCLVFDNGKMDQSKNITYYETAKAITKNIDNEVRNSNQFAELYYIDSSFQIDSQIEKGYFVGRLVKNGKDTVYLNDKNLHVGRYVVIVWENDNRIDGIVRIEEIKKPKL